MLDNHNSELKTILPLSVSNGNYDFILFAIWANNPEDKDGVYVTQIWKALHHYNNLFEHQRIVLAGDFNSNTIWDKPRREGNHSTVVKWLKEKNIHSVYHQFFKQIQGKEIHPTQFMYRHQDKPYHLDYCFVSSSILEKLTNVQIGSYESWFAYSDHTPLIVTFDL